MDDGMRSLVRCHRRDGSVVYRIFMAYRCRPDDPDVVIHNKPYATVQRYRKLVEDPTG